MSDYINTQNGFLGYHYDVLNEANIPDRGQFSKQNWIHYYKLWS